MKIILNHLTNITLICFATVGLIRLELIVPFIEWHYYLNLYFMVFCVLSFIVIFMKDQYKLAFLYFVLFTSVFQLIYWLTLGVMSTVLVIPASFAFLSCHLIFRTQRDNYAFVPWIVSFIIFSLMISLQIA